MAATGYSLRALANKLIIGEGELPDYGKLIPFESNLEKAGRAVRYATKTVQYYSPRYDYRDVQRFMNEQAKEMFTEPNELGN